MSGNDAGLTGTVILEKTVLTEMLQLYQSNPCLWDQKHTLYGNKEARDQAYEILLEKYKLIQSDAIIFDVKKKIEYMRCAYRREHKKVLTAYHNGTRHRPILWYYDLLAFLNDHRDLKLVKTEDLQESLEIVDSDEDDSPPKRIRMANPKSDNVIFLPEHLSNFQESEDQNYLEQDDQDQAYIVSNEAEAFGRTVGFQLKELNHMQRVFAEKLISDVIFQARLCNLSAKTCLNLNNE